MKKIHKRRTWEMIALTVALPMAAQAATWSGGNGNWDSDTNWGGTEPVSGELATVNNGDTVTVNQTGEIAGALALSGGSVVTVNSGDLTLDAVTQFFSVNINGGTMNVNGGGVTASGIVNNFLTGSGAINVSAGTFDHVATNLRFGDGASTGTLGVDGTGSWTNGNLNIIGTGNINLTGSSAQIGGININNGLGGNLMANLTPDAAGINAIGVGNLNLSGTDTLTFNTDGLVGAQSVTLFNYASLNGTFNTVNITNSYGGPLSAVGDIGSVVDGTYFLDYSTGSNVTLHYNAVPEPSSAALLGLGGLALVLRRRK